MVDTTGREASLSERDHVLAAVKANLPQVDQPLPEVPRVDKAAPASLLEGFKQSLTKMVGDFLEPYPGDGPLAPLHGRFAATKVVFSALFPKSLGTGLSHRRDTPAN